VLSVAVLIVDLKHYALSGVGAVRNSAQVFEKIGIHPHITVFFGVCERPATGNIGCGCGFVMEYSVRGTLERVLQDLDIQGIEPPTCGVLLRTAWQV
jgi:hypothetical protein